MYAIRLTFGKIHMKRQRGVSVLMALIVASGCSGATDTSVTMASVPGTYKLKTVLQKASLKTLPLYVGDNTSGGHNYNTLVSGSVVLRSDATFTLARHFEYRPLSGPATDKLDVTDTGTFTLSSGQLHFQTPDGGVIGTVDSRSIYLNIDGDIFTFSR